MSHRWLISLAVLLAVSSPGQAETPFELRDGDRVVLLGGTFLERDVNFGYLETALTAAYPDRKIVFRNLGWSGDTVWAESRGIFDPPEVGYQRMIDLVKEQKPTVVVLAYGQNESFAGEAGLEAFLTQYRKLVNDVAPTGARLVFWTPHRIVSPGPGWPDATARNAMIGWYSDAIAGLARELDAPVVRLDQQWEPQPEWIQAGVHPTPAGFESLGYVLASNLANAQPISPGGQADREPLRKKILEKNTLFFHRWRPQNVTYLFLFRKHEQGNNAVEIPQFDPLIAAAEKEIDALKRP
jgi:hypothetical protein